MTTDTQVRKLFRLLRNGETLKSASERTGISAKTARKYWRLGKLPSELRTIHNSRTRTDRFCQLVPELPPLIESKYDLNAKQLFEVIRQKYPAQFTENQLRTFQRLVKALFAARQKSNFIWMRKLLHHKLTYKDVNDVVGYELEQKHIKTLVKNIREGPIRCRNRAIAVLSHLKRISPKDISDLLLLTPRTIRAYITRFETDGVDALFDFRHGEARKSEQSKYREAVFFVLHAPPSSYNINRTTWRMKDIKDIMASRGFQIAESNIRKIIKSAGYRWRKAKTVLTSNDPEYREKLNHIQSILSSLGKNDRFYSIDEFGPFAVKKKGGRRLVAPGEHPYVPQFQKSKGCLIITAALELSRNQVTHFYSKKKDTTEMIKLLKLLLRRYKRCRRLYLSWDAASWHASNAFYEKVEEVNKITYRKTHCTPIVKLAPLPASAQFLNVIESVFSGMARAIIHSSDYQSVEEAMAAIDRYFKERNQHFRKHPKKAGNKIWRKELVPSRFSEGQNCKDPRW